MTAAQPQVRLLTIDEYAALGETDTGYTELLEGRVLVSPSPAARHNYAVLALAMQLVPQLPAYADAGIGHYWIVDLNPPVSLLAHHLAGDFGYAHCTAATGVFTTTTPFPTRVELDRLL
jgi:hypothetical protein